MKQNEHAIKAVLALKSWTSDNSRPIHGYNTLAVMSGASADHSRNFGQVCSRIDYACFVAGLPMLAYHWVRHADGRFNSSSSSSWLPYMDEILKRSAEYQWTAGDFDRVLAALNELPDRGAASLWSHAEEREEKEPGFYAHHLHRNCK